jgi:alpha-L-fucosidase
MKAGIYLSPWDRHESTWGTSEYNDYYVNQLTELLTNYGKIWEVWWDGAGSTEAVYDWDRWADTVRTLQPDAVIFGSLGAAPHVDIRWVGNEKGFAGKPCWGSVDESVIYREVRSELNSGKIDGERFIPAEVDVSIRRGWFYHKWQDTEVRSPENLLYLWSSSIGRNSGLLLNIPPDKRGLFHENDVESLLTFKRSLDKNLSTNHVAGATATAKSEYSEEYSVGNILSDRDEFYAPSESDELPTITLKLEGKKTFNTVILKEKIEYGHRIVDYDFYAKIDGEWKLLFANQCMGYTCVEHFAEVTADEVKLVIKNSRGVPLLKEIGLYSFTGHIEPRQPIEVGRDLLKNARISASEEENSLDINLGGVYPFNTISFGADKRVEAELLIFNGTRFERLTDIVADNGDAALPCDVDYAYRLKIIFKNTKAADVKLGITYEERK